MKKQNVVVIMVDQLRMDCLACYGNTQVKTPNIDKLCGEGTQFFNHFTSYPVCTPSRYSFFSGLYATEHLGWNNHCTLDENIDTFPKILRQNGYKTTAVGKMHMTPTYLDIGFDKMILAEQDGNGRFEDDYHFYLMNEEKIDAIDIIDQRKEYREKASESYFNSFGTAASDLPIKYHSTTWVRDNAVREIEMADENENNLFMFSFIKPHHPFDPPQEYLNMYKDVDIEPLKGYTEDVPTCDYNYDKGYFDHKTLNLSALKEVQRAYYAAITHIDDAVGDIIEALKQKSLYESSVIIFTSDHGDYMGFHHMMLKQNHMYDALMRIPLIICSGDGKAQKKFNLSDNTCIAQTVLSIILKEKHSSFREKTVFDDGLCAMAMNRKIKDGKTITNYMYRTQEHKLLLNGCLKNSMLFDVVNDRCEMKNLAEDVEQKGIFDKLKNLLFESILFEQCSQTRVDYKAKTTLSNDEVKLRSGKVEKYIRKKMESFR